MSAFLRFLHFSCLTIFLISGCATTHYQPAGKVESAGQLLHKGEKIKVVKVDGKSIEFTFLELKDEGIYGEKNIFIAKQDISRIEVKKTDPGLTPEDIAGAAIIIVVLPFMVLCSVVTGDNRSAGVCAWGH